MQINSRLPEVGTSIFTVMSRLALEQGAINLSQGFPDFPVSEELIELKNYSFSSELLFSIIELIISMYFFLASSVGM